MMRWTVAVLLLVLLAIAPLEAAPNFTPWALPSPQLPLGADEFGRNLLKVLLIATGRSLAFGTLFALGTLSVSTVLGWAASRQHAAVARQALSIVSLIIEGVPLFVWVLMAYTTLGSRSLAVAALALAVGVVPFASNIIAGEIVRIEREPFVEAARLSRLSTLTILRRHILPNTLAVTGPLLVLVAGLALAIPGAIGVLGFTRRADYSLGVLLLRGKENVTAHPVLLLSTIVAFVTIYLCLERLRRPRHASTTALPEIPATLQ